MERIKEADALQASILEKSFDFSKEETINVDYENLEYVRTKRELRNRWRLDLKLDVLNSYFDHKENQASTSDAVSYTDLTLPTKA